MRVSLAPALFALAVLAAACGGGGKSGVIPTSGQPSIATTPASHPEGAVTVVLRIPSATAQSSKRKPFYISPSTQSIVFAVIPSGSGTPTPADAQLFPVAAPSPCTTAVSNGAETCTFNVRAPFGTDIFYVATFNTTTPTTTTVPLAAFVSGAIVVSSPGPGPTASPLTFVVNGIVDTVKITVPNPDPNNTPNTQVFTVGVAQSPLPLGVTALDASNTPILSDGFDGPLTVNVAPANAGIALALNASCPGSGGSGSTVVVGCAADLAHVTFAYDGSVTPDANDHITDTFAISATQLSSPAPSPARVVLQSNVRTYAPNEGANSYGDIYLQSLSNNVIGYLMSVGAASATYGTLNVDTGAFGAQTALNVGQANAFYAMSDGSFWLTDTLTDTLQCFTSAGGNAVTTIHLVPSEYPAGITFDGTYLWWGTNLYIPSVQNYAYSARVTGTCTLGATTTYTLPTAYQENVMYFSPLQGGAMAIDGGGNGEFYTISAPPSGVVTLLSPGFAPGNGFGGGAATDAAGKTYAAFNDTTKGYISLFPNGGSALSLLVNTPQIQFGGLAAFGPSNTAADRLAYANTTYGTFDIVEGPNTATPVLVPVTIGYASFNKGQTVVISSKGAALAGYYDNLANVPTIGRTLLTTTWSVLEGQLPLSGVLSIDERGDSGPFTVVPVGTPPACFTAITPVAGNDHAFFIGTNFATGTCAMTVKVTDKNGRTQNITVTAPLNVG